MKEQNNNEFEIVTVREKATQSKMLKWGFLASLFL